MLKKFNCARFLLIPIALLSMMGAAAPQPNDLNRQLLSAVCTQNWIQAVGVVDRMMTIVPPGQVRGELLNYRGQLVGLSKSGIVLPPDLLTDCVSDNYLVYGISSPIAN